MLLSNKNQILLNFYYSLADLTNYISSPYTLEIQRSPPRITFETEDILFWIENSFLVDTFDVFLWDCKNDFTMSNCEVEKEKLSSIKEELWECLKHTTQIKIPIREKIKQLKKERRL